MWQTLWQWFLEPGNQKFYLGIIAALAVGFIIGHFARRQKEKRAKSITREGDQAFFKGIQIFFIDSVIDGLII